MHARTEYIQRDGESEHDFLPEHIRANIRAIDDKIDANDIHFIDSTISGELEIEHFRFTITYGRMNDFVDLMQLQQARRAIVARYTRDGRTKHIQNNPHSSNWLTNKMVQELVKDWSNLV